jgi:putative transposase
VGKTYQTEEIDTSRPAVPEPVSVALPELADDVREGLLALAVGDRAAGCWPRLGGGRDRGLRPSRPSRSGSDRDSAWQRTRYGDPGWRRVPVERPRMRATDGSGERAVPCYGCSRVRGARPDGDGADARARLVTSFRMPSITPF